MKKKWKKRGVVGCTGGDEKNRQGEGTAEGGKPQKQTTGALSTRLGKGGESGQKP